MSHRTDAVSNLTLFGDRISHSSNPWARLEPWHLSQLQRLAKSDPDRMESILNTLFSVMPGLSAELAIGAVLEGEMSESDAAERLGVEVEEIQTKVAQYRHSLMAFGKADVVLTERGAQVEGAQIFVWEIIREFRKLGSLERLAESFPGLTPAELGAALRFAQENPEQIESAIAAYEEVQSRKRSGNPFL